MPLPSFDGPEVRRPRFLESVATDPTPVKAKFRADPAGPRAEGADPEARASKVPLPSRWPSLGRTPGPGGVVIPPSVLQAHGGEEVATSQRAPDPARSADASHPHGTDGASPDIAPPRLTDGASAVHAARLAASVERLRSEAERLAERTRADALEIGFQVARRILEMELTASAEALFSLVRSAVRRAGESRTITVRLNPSDKTLIDEIGGAVRIDGPLAARMQIVADPSLSRGDCVVDTDFGSVDGRLDTRLSQLRRVLDSAFDEDGA